MFKIENANATLVAPIQIHGQATVPVGEKAKPTKMADVQLTLHLDVTEHMKLVEKLFPACDVQAKTIAGREECKGEVRKTNTKLGDMCVSIFYGADNEPVVRGVCDVKSAPQLHTSEDGNGKLVLKPRLQVPVNDVDSLCELINADVRVTMEPAQMDLSDATVLADGKEPEKQKRAKKEDLPSSKTLRAVGDPF